MSQPAEKKQVNAEQNEIEETAQQPQTTIRWDGSKMDSAYANVCNVTSGREEVTMLFGIHQSWHAGQKELTVDLTNRLILNPYAAKRLAILLGNTIREYEKRFGELKLDVPENNGER